MMIENQKELGKFLIAANVLIKDIHDAEKKANDLRIELKDVQWKMNKLLEGFSAGGDND